MKKYKYKYKQELSLIELQNLLYKRNELEIKLLQSKKLTKTPEYEEKMLLQKEMPPIIELSLDIKSKMRSNLEKKIYAIEKQRLYSYMEVK